MTDVDILISGGGVAGLAAASVFGTAGFSVLCVDPAPPITARDTDGADLRTTAFLQPAQKLLEEVGLWDRLKDHATPLEVMRIVDAGGAAPEPRITKEFKSAELSELPFGWNLPNWLLRREMVAHLGTLPNVEFRPGTGTASLLTRTAEARVGLSDGTRVRARLVIAADGRASPSARPPGLMPRPPAMARRRWHLPSRTRSRTPTSPQKFTAAAGRSRWFHCPITRACRHPVLYGWSTAPRPPASRHWMRPTSRQK